MQSSVNHGRFIAIVGPSGVGKDSLISGLCAAEPSLVRCRRIITRAPEWDDEDFEPIGEQAFLARADQGAFLLWWRAHGLLYAIPKDITQMLDNGCDVLANLSRSKLEEAAHKLPSIIVLNVTASPGVLAGRLAARGRETVADIQSRLARPAPPIPSDLCVISVANDGPLSDTIAQALDALSNQTA
jgi:ribose 1,5-bisphosphokinase